MNRISPKLANKYPGGFIAPVSAMPETPFALFLALAIPILLEYLIEKKSVFSVMETFVVTLDV